MTAAASQGRDRARGRAVALTTVLASSGSLASLQQTLVIPLIPDLPEVLGVNSTSASWVVTMTLLGAAVGMPVISKIADQYGRRRVVIGALVAMTAGSILVAASGSFAVVLIGRALQGASSALLPVAISILNDALSRERVGYAIALMSSTLGIGTALGPPLSGVLYEAFGFSGVFWAMAGAGIPLIVAVRLIVQESTISAAGRFDYPGAALATVALGAVLLAITRGGDLGWTSPLVLGLIALGIVVFAVWVPWELRVGAPMIDLRSAAHRPVLLTNLAGLAVGFCLLINLLSVGQEVQIPRALGGLGLSVGDAGLVIVPAGLTMLVVSPLCGWVLTRWGGRAALVLGTGLICAAFAFRAFAPSGFAQIVVGSVVIAVGIAVSLSAMPTLIMRAVPASETSAANGLNSVLRQVGGALASAAIAAALATAAVSTGIGPSPDAFDAIYFISTGAAAFALAAAIAVPRTSRAR